MRQAIGSCVILAGIAYTVGVLLFVDPARGCVADANLHELLGGLVAGAAIVALGAWLALDKKDGPSRCRDL